MLPRRSRLLVKPRYAASDEASTSEQTDATIVRRPALVRRKEHLSAAKRKAKSDDQIYRFKKALRLAASLKGNDKKRKPFVKHYIGRPGEDGTYPGLEAKIRRIMESIERRQEMMRAHEEARDEEGRSASLTPSLVDVSSAAPTPGSQGLMEGHEPMERHPDGKRWTEA